MWGSNLTGGSNPPLSVDPESSQEDAARLSLQSTYFAICQKTRTVWSAVHQIGIASHPVEGDIKWVVHIRAVLHGGLDAAVAHEAFVASGRDR